MNLRPAGLLLLHAGLCLAAREAPAPEPSGDAYRAHVLRVLEGIRYREGVQELPGGAARLELPEGYRYLEPEDARKVVVDLWGNPPAAATDILGLVVPKGEHLARPDSWAVVVSFSEVGHVSDEDADRIDFDGILARLKETGRQANREREAAGFDTLELAGWAVTPRYDKPHKVLHWAKRFKVADDKDDTLNYEVRVLGRRGVLSLNGIADLSRVADIEAASPAIVSMLRFNDGHRYGDFDPATDRKAPYSLAGLLAGGAEAPRDESPANSGKLPLIIGALGIGVLICLLASRRSAGK
jgi:uncharacterized membrane-anchored protein